MIGHFKDVGDAKKAKDAIDLLKDQVTTDERAGLMKIGEGSDRYTDSMLDLLGKVNVHSIGPAELEQFAYDVAVELKNDQVIIETEEIDVSAFLKVLVDKGARVEVYSAHTYPGTGHGRGK
jgi:hypothetical protein